jgi:hypothetical protein
MNIKSVITDWAYDGQFVWGHEPSTDKGIRTSTVKRIWLNYDRRVLCETQNSLYELSCKES